MATVEKARVIITANRIVRIFLSPLAVPGDLSLSRYRNFLYVSATDAQATAIRGHNTVDQLVGSPL